MSVAKSAMIAVIALLLAGCLTSDRPLLNDQNAMGTPLAPGAYQSCVVGEGEQEDCRTVTVSRDGALYTFEPQGEDASMARFRALGAKSFLAEMWEEGEGAYFYFYALKTADGAKLAMVSCPDIPARTRDSLMKSGALTVSSDGRSCEALTLRAAERAARAFGRRLTAGSNWMVLKRTDS